MVYDAFDAVAAASKVQIAVRAKGIVDSIALGGHAAGDPCRIDFAESAEQSRGAAGQGSTLVMRTP